MQLIIQYMQSDSFKVWKPQTPVLHINSASYTRTAFLNYWAFDIISHQSSSLKIFKLVMVDH